MNHFPVLLILVPLLACAFIAAGLRAKLTALTAAAINALVVLFLAFGFPAGSSAIHYAFQMPWVNLPNFFNIQMHLGVDGLNLPFLILTAFVSLSAVAVVPEKIQREKEFYINILLVIAGAFGAFMAFDLFFFFVFHELALIPTFLLIGIWGGHHRKFAASQITLYLIAGSLVLLAGLIGLYFALPPDQRTFDLPTIQTFFHQTPLPLRKQVGLFGFFILGFGILISLWPFHSWAPQGYSVAPPSAAMLHAGVLKKFGLYGLLRLAMPLMPEGFGMWKDIILLLLIFNILYIGLVTIAQKDLGLTLAYSSIMHMGYLFLGFVSANVLGWTGMVLLIVGHGLSTALLFALSGEIRQRTGTLQFSELGGLASKAPQLTFCFVLGAFASIGLPGLANFAGEILIFFGAWKKYPIVTAITLFGVVISAVYMLRAVRAIFYGEVKESTKKALDFQGFRQSWPYFLLVVALLVFGLCPNLLIRWAEPVIKSLL